MVSHEEQVIKRAQKLCGDTRFDISALEAVMKMIDYEISINQKDAQNEEGMGNYESVRALGTVNGYLNSLKHDLSILREREIIRKQQEI